MLSRFRKPEMDADARMAFLFVSINAFFFMSNAASMPYLTAHFADLGMDNFQIGILSSLGSLAAIFILPVWSRLSDRTGNRRGVLKILTLGAALTIILLMLSRQFWQLLISMFLFVCFYNCVVPLNDAVMVNSLAKTRFKFSFVRLGGTVGYTLFILLSGRIYAYNRNLSFIVSSLLLLGMFVLVRKMPQADASPRPSAAKTEKKKLDLKRLFKNKKIIFILLIACMIQIVLSYYVTFLGVYIRELGYGSKEIAYTGLVAALCEIPVLLVIDKALVYFSVPALALFSGLVMSVRILLLYNAEGMGLILLAQAGGGLAYMTLYYSCVTFLNNEMDDDMKSTGQSMLAFFQAGLGSILGNILGGLVSGRIGMKGTFLAYGIFLLSVVFICSVVLVVLHIKKKRKTEDQMPQNDKE